MKKLIKKLLGFSDEPVVLDHVKPKRKPKDWRDAAVKKAAAKHGRQFHTHTNVDRVTPPSRSLRELQEKSQPQQSAPVSILRNRSNA